VPGSSQKALIVNVEPVSDKPSKRSRVGTLIKKTARLIKRPFRF
jgi:hypothetical protein